jgi:uncharacterized protein YuzE
MEKPKIHMYYDKEADYLEIRFGEPTESHYDKIGSDVYVRMDEKTGEIKGHALFNVQKGTSPLQTIDVDIPLTILKMLKLKKEHNVT